METIEANAEPNGAHVKRGAAEQTKIDDGKRIGTPKGEPEVAQSKVTQSKLDDARAPRSTTWSALKARAESAWTHLEVAYRDLTSRTATTFSRWMSPPGNKPGKE